MAEKKLTFYEILGVAPSVPTSEIKRAYRQLVKTSHPDLEHASADQQQLQSQTEAMLLLNQAYETLMDRKRRAEYDLTIGITIAITLDYQFSRNNEDEERAKYLSRAFYPARNNISRVLSKYKKQLRQLSQDPYDDELLAEFERYLDEIETVLRNASNLLSAHDCPKTLEAATYMLRQCIAQAADGLDDLRSYCLNYDYNHLTTAEALFKIAADLSRQALALTK